MGDQELNQVHGQRGAPHVALIAQSFVNQYYWVLNENVQYLHQFYGADSTVVVAETLGSGTPRYVAEANNPLLIRVVMEHLLREVTVSILQVVPQMTVDDSLLIMVTGKMHQETRPEERCFTQVFILARQPNGFYIRTDSLQVHSPDTTAELLRISSVKACAHVKEKIREASATLVPGHIPEDKNEHDIERRHLQVHLGTKPGISLAYRTANNRQASIEEGENLKVEKDGPVGELSPRTPSPNKGHPAAEDGQNSEALGDRESTVKVCKPEINQVTNKLPMAADPVPAPGEAFAQDSRKESDMKSQADISGRTAESTTGQDERGTDVTNITQDIGDRGSPISRGERLPTQSWWSRIPIKTILISTLVVFALKR